MLLPEEWACRPVPPTVGLAVVAEEAAPVVRAVPATSTSLVLRTVLRRSPEARARTQPWSALFQSLQAGAAQVGQVLRVIHRTQPTAGSSEATAP